MLILSAMEIRKLSSTWSLPTLIPSAVLAVTLRWSWFRLSSTAFTALSRILTTFISFMLVCSRITSFFRASTSRIHRAFFTSRMTFFMFVLALSRIYRSLFRSWITWISILRKLWFSSWVSWITLYIIRWMLVTTSSIIVGTSTVTLVSIVSARERIDSWATARCLITGISFTGIFFRLFFRTGISVIGIFFRLFFSISTRHISRYSSCILFSFNVNFGRTRWLYWVSRMCSYAISISLNLCSSICSRWFCRYVCVICNSIFWLICCFLWDVRKCSNLLLNTPQFLVSCQRFVR